MGVAVNVTLVPAQIVVADAATITLTGKFALTVTWIALLVTVTGVAHTADEVTSNVTISLFTSAEDVNELLFVPTALPFNFH